MSNKNLFKKKELADTTLAALSVPAGSSEGVKIAVGGVEFTQDIDDEVAELLSEGAEVLTVEAEPAKKPAFSFTKKKTSDYDAKMERAQALVESSSGPKEIEGEIVSELEAPVEFAHEAQPDKYDNPVLQQIKDSLQLVKDNINDEQIVGDAIYNLMQQMAQDPELADLLEPEDFGIMVRGLRESYHVVVTQKIDKAKKKSTTVLKVDAVTELLGEIQIK